MSTSVQQHQGAMVDGVHSPDRGGLLSRCQESWSRVQCQRPVQLARVFQSADRMRPLSVLAWGFALLVLLPHVFAEALASGFAGGPDFPINTNTAGDQQYPSVSVLSGGGFVVTWQGNRQGGSGTDISGRLFAASGMALGPDFPINTYTTGDQHLPSVSALSGGGFVVTWFGAVEGGDGDEISGRLFAASGMALGPDFPINTYTTGNQWYPSVSALSGGGFVATWSGNVQNGSGFDISGRLFYASGMALGPDFPINTYTTGTQLNPSVSVLSGGGFVVTWQANRQGGSGFDISGRLFAASGMALGPDFPINTYTTGNQYRPSVSALSGGGFVVIWYGDVEGGFALDISGRLFDASGMALGPDFPINTYTTGDQAYPSVSVLSGGGFVVSWWSEEQGGSGFDISGRLFDASGMAVGSDIPINTYTRGGQSYPSVSALSGGGFVVTWWGAVQGGFGWDISGRLFTLIGTTTTAPPTTQVVGGTTGSQRTTTGPNSATTAGLLSEATSTGAIASVSSVAEATTAGIAVSPQSGMDSPGPALAAGIGAGAAALVCSLLTALGLVLMRRRRVATPAADGGESPPSPDVAMNTRPAYDRLPTGAASAEHGESSVSISSLPYTDHSGLEATHPDQYSALAIRKPAATVNEGAMYGQLAEKTDNDSSPGGAAYGHVIQNGGAVYAQLAEKTGDNSSYGRVVYADLLEKADGESSKTQ